MVFIASTLPHNTDSKIHISSVSRKNVNLVHQGHPVLWLVHTSTGQSIEAVRPGLLIANLSCLPHTGAIFIGIAIRPLDTGSDCLKAMDDYKKSPLFETNATLLDELIASGTISIPVD